MNRTSNMETRRVPVRVRVQEPVLELFAFFQLFKEPRSFRFQNWPSSSFLNGSLLSVILIVSGAISAQAACICSTVCGPFAFRIWVMRSRTVCFFFFAPEAGTDE